MNITQFFMYIRARYKLAIVTFFAVMTLTLVGSLLWPKKYRAEASVVVDVKPDPISGMLPSNAQTPSIIATQIDIITSDRVARMVIAELKLAESPVIKEQWRTATDSSVKIETWLSQLVRNGLEVKPSRESNVITIAYYGADPSFSAALANAFAQAYLKTTLELRTDPAKQYNVFFDKQSKDAKMQLEAAQTALSDFQRSSGIIGGDERLDIETTRLNELSSQLVALQSVTSDSDNRQNQVTGGNADRLSDVINNPVVSSIKVEITKAEAAMQEASTRLGTSHPQIEQMAANLAELKAKLEAEQRKIGGSVGVLAKINQARLVDIKMQLEQQRAKVLKLREARDTMSVLQREVENAQRAYDAISARKSQVSLESQTLQSNVTLLSQAETPYQASSPKLALNMLAGFIAAIGLAIGSVFIAEALDPRLRDAQLVANTYGLQVIGALPRASNQEFSKMSMSRFLQPSQPRLTSQKSD